MNVRSVLSSARGLLLPLLLLASSLPANAQVKRAMTVEDLISAVRVSDPQVSPDGKRTLYVRTITDPVSGKRNSDIWSVMTDGSAAPSAFIQSPKGDDTPRFLADGRVAFMSSRDGANQVYIVNADGSNARAVTHLSAGAQGPLVVSPDGKFVAFVSDVSPACADEACNARTREAAEKDPVKVHELTRLPFRHWDEWWTDVRHHVFVADIASGRTTDITPGDYDSPPHNYEDAAIAISPDSREVAFVSKRGAKDSEMWTTNHDVWTIAIDGMAAKKLTTNPAADFQPTYSPDGKWIVVRAQRRPGFEGDRWYLDAYDRKTGGKHTIFETPDLSVDDFHFSPDGSTIWFTANQNATENLYTVPITGGVPKMMVQGGAVGAFQPSGSGAVFAKTSLTAPPDVYSVSASGSLRQLTSENAAWLNTVDLRAAVTATANGAAGAKVQYWLLTPPNFDPSKKYPVVFLIHGGPQGAWEDAWSNRWNPSLWAAQGWVVAAPNPRGSTGFGQKFVDEISQDWCGKVMTDLNSVFDAVEKLPYVDASRAGIAGASYGGYAVDWIIGHTNRFKSAVTHDGVFNLESMSLSTEELWFSEWEFGGAPSTGAARSNFARCSPHLSASKIKTPTLVITNQQDFRVPVDQGLQLFTSLRRNGVPSKGLVFENEGHWVLNPLDSRRWHTEVFGWMNDHLRLPTP